MCLAIVRRVCLALRKLLEPLRQTLADQPFIGGDAPLYPDYIVFGTLQWPRAASPLRLLEPSDPVEAWRQRLLDSFDGLGAQLPATGKQDGDPAGG